MFDDNLKFSGPKFSHSRMGGAKAPDSGIGQAAYISGIRSGQRLKDGGTWCRESQRIQCNIRWFGVIFFIRNQSLLPQETGHAGRGNFLFSFFIVIPFFFDSPLIFRSFRQQGKIQKTMGIIVCLSLIHISCAS